MTRYFDAKGNMYPYEGIIPQEGVVYTCSDEMWDDLCQYPDKYIWEDNELKVRPTWAEIYRQKMDALTLTPADVERALYDRHHMDFDDLKAYIHEQLPELDIKRVAIEFKAKDFYRGAQFGNMRLFDVIGQLLGYTVEDMDYLFEHKELPTREVEE